ncbi:S1C family serine protease [Microbacterium gorillae]|uniref:S1C family serine protease n=1 Tax=Microbacterium gorillae TaxID=1231063 RepID=UPI0006950082|nr:trypsin-like peptidase domain-containing protein [Microbacterium gorillae]
MLTTPAKRPWWRARPFLLAAAAVGVLAIGFVGGLVGGAAAGRGNAGAVAGSCDAVEVTDRVLPTVVTVWASGAAGSGNGSGAILSTDGLVVTNDHVISSALTGSAVSGSLAVTLADGERLEAELVGRDPQTDLAVLRVKRDGTLPAIRFGASGEVRVGQPVVALGAPLGRSNTVTAGIVSALGRSVNLPTGDGGVTVITGAVQTDAAINPGNSGGALVDCAGALVGINTAITTVPDANGTGGGGSIGIGYAIPADTVRAITDDLIENGRVDHPSFGMETATLTPAVAAQFGVPPGLVVTSVVAGGSADAAGVQVGDLITRLGEQEPPTVVSLAYLTVRSAPGDSVSVTIVRDGTSTMTKKIELQPDPTK